MIPAPPITHRPCPLPMAELQALRDLALRNPVESREGDRDVLLYEAYFPSAIYFKRRSRAFGYFARPKLSPDARVPAMLLIHGGGGSASPSWARSWARRGYAALAVDLYGQGPGKVRLPDGGPDWSNDFASFKFAHTGGLENTWIFQSVATCIAGVTALCQIPEVDPNRIGVTGVSWGGWFCSTVMCIDDRLRLGIPVYACGYNPRVAHGDDPNFIDGKIQREAFDGSNFFPQCRKRVLWVQHTGDARESLDELRWSIRATPGPNKICLTVNPGHNDPQSIGVGDRVEIEYFADYVLRGGPPLIALGEPAWETKSIVVPFDPRAARPEWAVVHHTSDLDKPWGQRRWHSTRAEPGDGKIIGTVAAEKPFVAFLNAADARGAVVSSHWLESQ